MVIENRDFDAQHWVKTRSSLDPNQSNFLAWTGAIHALIPGEKKIRLFKMVGVSVSRCIPAEEGAWDFTSRELTYYLHPETGEVLQQWENPWTGELLTVMHVANNPVQGYFKGKFPAQVYEDSTTFVFDIFSTYPNPLATDPKFADYSPNPTYQAVELFKITVPTDELLNPEILTVSKLQLYWDRIGPWVPWMKMGDRPGQLIYSAYGGKVNGLDKLPQILRDEINTRVPLYKQAPQSYLEGEDSTSWLHFQKYFDAYLARERFPLPQPEE
ncbi:MULTISPECIES: DUF1838 domain-containing protein [unclassified Leptolyngbya]|uniref:DUF1838 domain-containing protein n=1 Tax=unclassified Leptolyngbya TaxID=2650499 RepID=UPI001689B529|nr:MULTISPECIES: DUF1838 domain-containing protein [unclassified Leptolyngbya]MBD1911782.1 DUF1838 domain-containing protein [Leptolyngbya sp. FACHB-8]MBD2153328.1 DUF1838 domain-containing protein [Leptolyngbya sp. FACHB-16]